MNGSVECLKLLFISGANLSLINDQKDTPLHDSASAGKEGYFELTFKFCLSVFNIQL